MLNELMIKIETYREMSYKIKIADSLIWKIC